VKPDGPGNVSFKTGHADAHVSRVAPFLQKRGKHADKGANANDAPPCGKKVFELTHLSPPLFHALKPFTDLLKSRISIAEDQLNHKFQAPNLKQISNSKFQTGLKAIIFGILNFSYCGFEIRIQR
jgi:hypothetical protein